MRGDPGYGYSRAASRNTPRDIYNGSDDDADGIPLLARKLLGPLAPLLLPQDLTDAEELQSRLRMGSASLLGASAFFWLWAVYNTYHLRSSGGFDLGAVSFFGSGVSSALLLRSSLGGRCYDPNRKCGCLGKKNGREEDDDVDVYGIRRPDKGKRDDGVIHKPPGKCLRAFAALTHVTVAANYMLGLLFAFTAGTRVYVYFATYCAIFSMLWLLVALTVWILVGAYREAVRRAYGEGTLDGPPRQSCLRWALISLANRSSAGYGAGDNEYYPEEEDDDIDDELRQLYEGRGGYTKS